MSGTERLLTAEEFARMPEDDLDRYELVEGRLVRMSPPNFDHGRIVGLLTYLLAAHLKSQPAGVVVVETGFTLATNPDTVRGPDISFLSRARAPVSGTHGFPQIAPDAVFEVLSPDDRAGEIRTKIAEYLGRGVQVVVVVDPDDRTVVVHRSGAQPVTLRGDSDVLDLADTVPGFTCLVRDIWE